MGRAAGQQHAPAGHVDTRHLAVNYFNLMRGVEAIGPERHRLLLIGREALREHGAVVGHFGLAIEQADAALVALAAQHLGRRAARRARPNDDHGGRVRRRFGGADGGQRVGQCLLAGHVGAAVALSHRPTRQRVEGGGAQGRPGAQAETGVVPGAAHGVAVEQALAQRRAQVATLGRDGKDFIATSGQQHGLTLGVAGGHGPVGQVGEGEAVGEQVGAGEERSSGSSHVFRGRNEVSHTVFPVF